MEWDSDNDGVPDNYFYVANPAELWDSLDRAFSLVLQRQGTAGAVATVTQEVQQEDVVVRAAFESFSQTNPSIFSWIGHMESYIPYAGCAGSDNATCRGLSRVHLEQCGQHLQWKHLQFSMEPEPQSILCRCPLHRGVIASMRATRWRVLAYASRNIRTYVASAWTPLASVPSSNFTINHRH